MYVKVRVMAGMKKETFSFKEPDTITLSIKEEAKQNMANKRIIDIVAKHFNVPRGLVRIINGHTSPSKILSVDLDRK